MDRKTMPAIKTVTRLNLARPQSTFLSNGIPVVIVPAGSEPVCRLDLVFDAGSRNQDIIFQSSLTNQMIPEGTPGMNGGTIAEEFEFYGSYFNVSADRDEAEITVHSLEKHLEPVLNLMSQVVRNPSFPEDELGIIKANRVESMKVDDQRVESLARKEFNRLIFGMSHPYGVVGEIPDVDAVGASHLKGFHARWYNPAHCRIMITGPKPDEYLALVNRFFGDGWPRNEQHPGAAPVLPAIESSLLRRSVIPRMDAVQTAIRIGRPLFSRLHPDHMGLTIVNTILGGYFGSRLMSNIREQKGYTYGISSHLPTLRDSGYFVIGSAVGAEVWEDTVKECFIEMQKLCSEKVADHELELVRNYLIGMIQRSLDGPFQVADQLRSLWTHNLGLDYLTGFMELISSITPGEIRDLAARHLDPSQMTVVAAGPIQTTD
jgi:predicted Zn-dependent peptidase